MKGAKEEEADEEAGEEAEAEGETVNYHPAQVSNQTRLCVT